MSLDDICSHQYLHAPVHLYCFLQNKKKMSLDDFARINRNTNEGEPMPRELLEGIYSSISRDELKISSGRLLSLHAL